MRSSLVHWYICARCAYAYVGSTTRKLHTRVCEQIGRSHSTGLLPLASPEHSNVRLYAEQYRVSCDDSNFRFGSEYEFNQETLRFSESFFICKFKPSINDLKSVHKLLLVHSGV